MNQRILCVIPTPLERNLLESELSPLSVQESGQWVFETIGLGVAISGTATAIAINHHQPDHVVLAGIAGALEDKTRVGRSYQFDRVILDGIGVGTGPAHQSTGEMGWNQWDAPSHSDAFRDGSPIDNAIDLHENVSASSGTLLTVCAASANEEEARRRLISAQKYTATGPIAEDMEGFAVAAACRLVGVPLSIIRGISNVAGQRDHSLWKTRAAMKSVAAKLLSLA